MLPLSGQRRERDSGVCINCSNLAPTMLHRFSKNFLHSDNSVICIQRINPGQALLSFSSSQLPFQRISISALRRRVVFECSLSVPDTTDITYFIRRCKKDLRLKARTLRQTERDEREREREKGWGESKTSASVGSEILGTLERTRSLQFLHLPY